VALASSNTDPVSCMLPVDHMLDAEGKASLCAFIYNCVNTAQNSLLATLFDDIFIGWVRRDYVIGGGRGTSSTQVQEHLCSLETILLMFASDDSIDLTHLSPMQNVIRNSLRAASLTKDQVTELIYKAFPLCNNLTIFKATDNHGRECNWYQNVQWGDGAFLQEQQAIKANLQ
jgi:hypothetical protein